MIQIGDKEYRNLMEQVGKNMTDIEAIKQALGNALPDPIPGPDGPQGVGVSGAEVETGNKLYIVLTNGERIYAGVIHAERGERGLKGDDGPVGKQIQDMTAIDSSEYTGDVDPAIAVKTWIIYDSSAKIKFGDTEKEIDLKLKYAIPTATPDFSNNTVMLRDNEGKVNIRTVHGENTLYCVANNMSISEKSGRENVLINSNFKINQRGQQSYISSGRYTVDRWKFVSGSGQIRPTSEGLRVTPNAGYTIKLSQYIEGDITGLLPALSCKFKPNNYSDQFLSSDGGALMIDDYPEQCILQSTGFGVRVYIGQDVSASKQYNVSIEISNDTIIKFVKLELTDDTNPGLCIPTPYTPPFMANEMLRCQRYYQRISMNCLPVIALGTNSAAAAIPLTTTMRAIPYITVFNMPTIGYGAGAININIISPALNDPEYNQLTVSITSAAALTTDKIYVLGGGGDIGLSAEIED